eukprot:tig00020902_g14967.t1
MESSIYDGLCLYGTPPPQRPGEIPELRLGSIFRGVLHVRVVEARNLRQADVFSKSDPFCIVRVRAARPFGGLLGPPTALIAAPARRPLE